MESTGIAPFERLIETLRLLYPLIHERLELERPTELGLLFRWRGSDESLANEPLILMAHFDVVPAVGEDGWTYPPFEGVIDRGRVWGRGTLDDKGALVCLCEAVESLLASGFTPRRDIYLSLGGSEETFGADAAAIAATLKERGIRPYLVLDEGGAVVDAPLSWVKVRAAMVGVGEKGIMTVRLQTKADPGHASTPSSLTAVSRIGRAVARLTASTFPANLPTAVTTMLSTFIPHVSGAPQLLLKALVKAPGLTAQVFTRMGGEPAAMAHTTVAPTMIEGGTASNVLPSQASAMVNVRIALGESTQSALERIRRRIADSKVEVSIVEGSEPSPESPTDNAQFAAIRAAVEASYPSVVTAPYVMMATTDSRHFHEYAEAVYRFAPLEMNATQRGAVHGVDEWVEIDSLERGQVFYEHLIRSTAGTPDEQPTVADPEPEPIVVDVEPEQQTAAADTEPQPTVIDVEPEPIVVDAEPEPQTTVADAEPQPTVAESPQPTVAESPQPTVADSPQPTVAEPADLVDPESPSVADVIDTTVWNATDPDGPELENPDGPESASPSDPESASPTHDSPAEPVQES